MYRNIVNYVVFNNRRSDTFVTREGLRQGGGLSPTIFTVFMDVIIKKSGRKQGT